MSVEDVNKMIAEITARNAANIELNMQLDYAHRENRELKEALRDLIKWDNEPEVQSLYVIGHIHGIKYNREQIQRLRAPWDRARVLLGLSTGTEA